HARGIRAKSTHRQGRRSSTPGMPHLLRGEVFSRPRSRLGSEAPFGKVPFVVRSRHQSLSAEPSPCGDWPQETKGECATREALVSSSSSCDRSDMRANAARDGATEIDGNRISD